MNQSKIVVSALIAVLALLAGAFALGTETEESDASTTFEYSMTSGASTYQKVNIGDLRTIDHMELLSGTMPPGISVVKGAKITLSGGGGYEQYFSGTPTVAGIYSFKLELFNINGGTAEIRSFKIYVNNPEPVKYTVTYNASPGLVNGSSTWKEDVISSGHPALPAATYSSGAYSFLGWATSSSAKTPNVTGSYAVTGDVTFYAVWEQNSASISSWSETVGHGQSFSHAFTTTPSTASATVSSAPDGWGVTMSGKTLSGIVPDGIAPGKYYITLKVSASGYATTTKTITITVPVYIVPPIERQQATGTVFSYEPVTNPTNSNVTINSIKFNGSTLSNSGFSVQNRVISGPLNNVGTYEISFTVSASGYASTTLTVRVYAFESPGVTDPPMISSISANQRPAEPRTWDFIAVAANYASISWSMNGKVFQSASTTSVFEFQTSGVYTVKCELVGYDGSKTSATKTVAVMDTYHPELAWAGVPYSIVVSGTPSTDMLSAIWLTASAASVDGTTYTVISGTPTSAHVGSTYTFSVGGVTKSVTVYAAETVPPTASFETELSSDAMKVTIKWTGEKASVVYYDYGDGSPVSKATSHTYDIAGHFVIVATAVNNLGERLASHIVFTGGAEDPVPSTRPLDLTDISLKKGEKVHIPLTLFDGESVTLLGSATAFVKLVDHIISGETADVALGVYELTVTLTSPGAAPVQKTIKITILAADDSGGSGLLVWYVVMILAILFAVFILVKVAGGKKKKKTSKRKGKGRRR